MILNWKLIHMFPGADVDLDSEDEDIVEVEADPYEAMLGTLPPQQQRQLPQQQGARRTVTTAVSRMVPTRRKQVSVEEPSKRPRLNPAPSTSSSSDMTVAEGLQRLNNLTAETAADLSWSDLEKLKSLREVIGKSEKESKKDGDLDDDEVVKITGEIRVEYGKKVKTIKLEEDGDAGHSILARHFLRVPNTPVGEWFTRVDGLNVSHPVRGGGQHLTGVMGSQRINDGVLKLLHSRTSSLHHKMLLSKNSCVEGNQKLIMVAEDSSSAKIGSKWQEATSCHEVVEAVLNYDAAIHYIRGYSHESRAIIRGFHRIRWFIGVSENQKAQMKMISGGFDRLLMRNRNRASEGQPPLQCDEVVEVLRSYFAEQSGGAPDHLLTSGDCYGGSRPKEATDYFAYLQSRKGAQGGGYGGGHGGNGGQTSGYSKGANNGKKSFQRPPQSRPQNYGAAPAQSSRTEMILNGLCKDHNRGSCGRTAQTCRFKHLCNKLIRYVCHLIKRNY